jgi:hypothetical protein
LTEFRAEPWDVTSHEFYTRRELENGTFVDTEVVDAPHPTQTLAVNSLASESLERAHLDLTPNLLEKYRSGAFLALERLPYSKVGIV